MSRGFIKDKKFHPIRQNRTRYKKSAGTKSIVPKFELKLPDRKESFSQLKSDIERDAVLRESLIKENESLAEKIEANPLSEFNPSRKEEIRDNSKVIKKLNGDIRHNLSKLTQDEKRLLPDEIKNLRRFL